MRIIMLREPATCAGCGKWLPAGTRARYYSRDKIYCEEHGEAAQEATRPPGPEGQAPPARTAVLQFLERVDVALRELIDALARRG